MKKVEKVSIAEISFTLDNDAYISLKQYLDSLHDYYDKDPDGREIIADIEARIAELILDEQVYTKVVSKPLVDTIVAQLGTPEEIDDEAGEGEGFSSAAGAAGSGGSAYETTIPRRLHRSSEGKIFGGVCSGLAKFMDINVAWIRSIFLLPIILSILASPFHRGPFKWMDDFSDGWSAVFFLTYIVLWIALPMAKTPRQKLEARGEKITPSSIRQNLQGAVHTPAGKKAASVAAELVNVLGRVVLFFVKFVMAIVGFLILFAAIGIFIAMCTILFTPASVSFGFVNAAEVFSALSGMAILSPALFVALILLCAIIPLFVMGMALLSFTFGWRLGRIFYSVTLGLWGLSMIFCGIVASSNARFIHDEFPHRIEKWSDGEWRGRHGSRRVEIREIRETFRDSLEVVEGPGRDTVIFDGNDGRVTIRRVEE